jgi:uncharacterized membrane protein
MKTLDATPEKRIFLSIITEYDLKKSICELIDNAIDLWSNNKRADLEIKIKLDDRQQAISIEDNAGGIEENKLNYIVSPGKTTNDIRNEGIGYFGVGSKRAVVALAQNITINSRFENEKTFTIKFDDDWINDNSTRELPYFESKTVLLSLATSVFYAFATPVLRLAGLAGANGFVFCVAFASPLLVFGGVSGSPEGTSTKSFLLAFVAGSLLACGFRFAARAFVLPTGHASIVAILTATYPALTVILSVLFLGEAHKVRLGWVSLGTILILLGVVIVVVLGQKPSFGKT